MITRQPPEYLRSPAPQISGSRPKLAHGRKVHLGLHFKLFWAPPNLLRFFFRDTLNDTPIPNVYLARGRINVSVPAPNIAR